MIRLAVASTPALAALLLWCIPAAALSVKDQPLNGGRVNPMIYGGFIELLEDVVPGMWAEMLNDRDFEGMGTPASWCCFDGRPTILDRQWAGEGDGTWTLDTTEPFNATRSAKLTVSSGHTQSIVMPEVGFTGRRSYDFSGYFRTSGGEVTVTLSLQYTPSSGSRTVVASGTLPALSSTWTKLDLRLTPSASSSDGVFAITVSGAGSVWIDKVSLMPIDNIHGWRADVVAAVRDREPGVIRWGGSTVDPGAYKWKNGIGDRDLRDPFANTVWGRNDSNDVGIDEFLQFCEAAGVEPLVCVSCGDGADSAADMVQYCNGDVSTLWGAKRAANGHPDPYGVKYWQIGNELGGAAYAEGCPAFCTAIRGVDPAAKILSSFPSAEVLAQAGSWLECVCPHYYTDSVSACDTDIGNVAELIKSSGRDVKIGVTEWNRGLGWGLARAGYWSVECGLLNAQFMNMLQRHSDVVELACRSSLANSYCGGEMQLRVGGMFFTPDYCVMKLYANESKAIPIQVSSAPANVDVSATMSDDGSSVCLMMVNDSSATIGVHIDFEGFEPAFGPVSAKTVFDTTGSTNTSAANSWEEPNRIRTVSLAVTPNSVALPPNSVTAVQCGQLTVAGEFVLTGHVSASADGTPLVGALVSDGTTFAATDEAGAYALFSSAGTKTITARMAGYVSKTCTVSIAAANNSPVDFALDREPPKTYHVSTSGNDSNSGLTVADAWKTIDNGDRLGILQPGDTVLVHTGTYVPLTSNGVNLKNCGGSLGLPVTYKADGNVLIDWGNASGHNLGIYVQGANAGKVHDIVVDGFEIKGCPYGLVVDDGAARVVFQNCYVHHLYQENGTGMAVGIWNFVTSDCEFRNNVIKEIGSAAVGAAGSGECAGVFSGSCQRSLYIGNAFDTIGNPAFAVPAGAITVGGCTDTHIYNNTFLAGTNAIRPWSGSSGTKFINNIVTGMRESGIGNWDGAGAVVNDYNLFYNNAVDYSGNVASAAHEIHGQDPLLTSDYHLASGSPAVDSGLDLGLLAFIGNAPDLGAFESSYGASPPSVARISDLRELSDGGLVSLSGKVATASSSTFSDGSYYIEEPNRSSGIRVVPRPGLADVDIGRAVDVTGVTCTDANGERCLDVARVCVGTNAPVGPVGINNRAFGLGLMGSGLLVTIWGKVTFSSGSYFYIDDGAGLSDGTGHTGIRVVLSGLTCPVTESMAINQNARVTGLVGKIKDGASVISVVRPRGDADMSTVQG